MAGGSMEAAATAPGDGLKSVDIELHGDGGDPPEKADAGGELGPLDWSHRFAGGLKADIARRWPMYKSDWTDAFKPENRSQVASSTVFLFFACLSPAVTFGMLFEDNTGKQLGVTEMILSSGISGIAYAFFSGQPLCILGATGPELAYTIVFYKLCEQLDLEFLPARVWQGLWTAIFTILLSVFDCSALMKHVTRFTEEIFSALISIIFISEALINVVKLYKHDDIENRAGAFLGTFLAFGTYGLAAWFKKNKGSKLFTQQIRVLLANYGVTISILVISGIAAAFSNVPIEKLSLPDKLRPTYTNPETGKARDWLVNPMGVHTDFPVWGIFFTALPALGLCFLGYMDQNLTSLLINRKDSGLKKPPAYHLDLLVCGVVVYPICCFLGLPFTHAATVRSVTHLNSLTERETIKLPGGGTTTRVASVIEQRVTNLMIHVLLMCSLALSPALSEIPKTVLYGVFLFMGEGSMAGNELFDRLFLWGIWDSKNWPKYSYVEKVSAKKMHLFTAFQFSMLVILYTLTRLDYVSVVFPFFIGCLVFIRKAMHRGWTPEELAALDG
eukprot:CAMPEP_0183791820 /NCGR_PEP_ID=MMETSP0803_2-20130417/2119_1 /TAXON_ID=195967 /ORGANISM="Crustomastix stigmata, Strain CCMP3273" /LENGTH=557 /DNA_ID=CAMNT_0026036153 /DNA_START=149 /DNA_END=1822 /DNA_ORIENTATION=+